MSSSTRIEKFWPLLFTIIATALFYFFQKSIPNIEELIKKLLETSLAVSGALLGFLLTILTIINTIATRRMKFIKDLGKYKLLNHYLKMALWFDLVNITYYFLFPLIFSLNKSESFVGKFYTVTVALIVFTWLLNIRFSLIFISALTDSEN